MSRNEFIQACIKNDKNARHQLIEQHYGYLMGLCRRYAKSNGQAETFFNQAFIEIFKHLPEYQDTENIEDWIKKTFLKSVIYQLKSNRTEYYITTTTRIEEKKGNTDLFQQNEEEDPNSLLVEDYIKALHELLISTRPGAQSTKHELRKEFKFDRFDKRETSPSTYGHTTKKTPVIRNEGPSFGFMMEDRNSYSKIPTHLVSASNQPH